MQVLNLVVKAMNAMGGGPDPSAIYLLLTGPNVGQGSSRSSFCKNCK